MGVPIEGVGGWVGSCTSKHFPLRRGFVAQSIVGLSHCSHCPPLRERRNASRVGSFRTWVHSWRKRREDRPCRRLGKETGSTDPLATELKRMSLVQMESSPFRQGMNDGALWSFHGDTPPAIQSRKKT
jgi:hypothetical protein